MSDFDAEATPVQRTVNAAAAAPVSGARTPWPFERFTASDKVDQDDESKVTPAATTPPPTVNRGRSDLPKRIVSLLRLATSPLNVLEVSEALNVPYDVASRALSNATSRRLIRRTAAGVQRNGGSTFAALTDDKATAESRPSKPRKTVPAPAPAIAVPAPTPSADAGPALRYALFNDGALRLEVGDSALNLPPAQTRELLTYLQRVSPVLA